MALFASERGSGFTTDEGSYAIQAEAIRQGSWAIDWPFGVADPHGRHFPYHAWVVSNEGEFASVSHPAWPLILAGASSIVAEEVGLRLISLASVLGAALIGFALATQLHGPQGAPWAFWIVATSPLLANGLMLWAHAPAAVLAGFAVLAMVKVFARTHPGWSGGLALSLGAGVLLRSEFVLFAAALIAVVTVAGLARRSAALVGTGVGAAFVTVAAMLGEHRWISAIVGDQGSVNTLTTRAGGPGGWIGGRVKSAVVSLLEGSVESPASSMLSLLAVLFALLAVVTVLLDRPTRQTLPLLWACAALQVGRLVTGIDDPVRGLISAWPIVMLGMLAIRRDAHGRRIVAVIGLFAVGVLATQYDDGGGLQWGGRFFALAIVPLGALAASGLTTLRLRERNAAVPVAAILVAGAVLSLVVTDHVRSVNAAAMRAVASTSSDVVLISNAQTARLDWRGWPEHCWLLVDETNLSPTLALLEATGVSRFTYVLVEGDAFRAVGLDPHPLVPGSPIGTVGESDDSGRCPGTERTG